MKGIFPMTISLTCHGSGTKWRRRRGSKEKIKAIKHIATHFCKSFFEFLQFLFCQIFIELPCSFLYFIF